MVCVWFVCGLYVVCVIFLRLSSHLQGLAVVRLSCSSRTARFSFPTRKRFTFTAKKLLVYYTKKAIHFRILIYSFTYTKRSARMWGRKTLTTLEPCLCEIRPIAVESPQTAKGGRGLATNSGETRNSEAMNVPYK